MKITKKEITRVVEMFLLQGTTENFYPVSKKIIDVYDGINESTNNELSTTRIINMIHYSINN